MIRIKTLGHFTLLIASAFTLKAAAGEVFTTDEYLFAGTYEQMTETLEARLAQAITAKCGAGYGARLSHTSVVLQLGPLAGGRGLDVEVASDTNGRPRLRFPGHPYAKLSTVVECQKVRP